MFKLFYKIYMAINNRIIILINPTNYAKRVGVNLGINVKFYSLTVGAFGSEPWMITIGNDVHIAGGCNFITHDGGVLVLRKKHPTLEITKPIKIGNYIGINCTILPGVTIGDNVIVGSASVVTKNIPSNCVIAGVPAKVIKSIDEYESKVLNESLGFGHLESKEKAEAIKKYYGIKS